jgi:hypothetical protein
VVAMLTDQLHTLNDIQVIYESLNDNERFGIRFGLFPLRIKDQMEQWGISPVDLMEYDEIVRSKHP